MLFVPLPYMMWSPGSAEEIRPIVSVKQGADEEKGTLMLTTVMVSDTNFVKYVYAMFNPHAELYKKKDFLPKGETLGQYFAKQQYTMVSSQSSAIQAAYHKAGVLFHIQSEGVAVRQTIADMPASKELQIGDYILSVASQDIYSLDDLYNSLNSKQAGDTVDIVYRRGKMEHKTSVQIALFPQDSQTEEDADASEPRSGLGISPVEIQSVQANDEEKQVTISVEDIGGPSAGLMFALEIYNQLVPGDITKGHRIAGTGTIDPEGYVGPIGGVQHKIVAANRAGAEIFFAPSENYSVALAKAQKIGSKMKVISVNTMDDALLFLDSLSNNQR